MKKQALFIMLSCGLGAQLAASPVDVMVGSRGIGMGGAYVAIADDQSAAYWNPAGLSQVENVSVMESNLLYQVQGLNVNYMSLAVPVDNVGTVCGSWLLTSASLDEGWDYTRNAPQSTSSANEQKFVLSIGRQLWKELSVFKRTSVGFSINRYTFSASNDKGAGVGLDLALLTHLPYDISFGFMGRDLGADIAGEPIDPEARFGFGYNHSFGAMHRLTAGLDGSIILNRDYFYQDGAIHGAGSNLKVFGGLEYALNLNGCELAVRGGTNGMLHSSLDTYCYCVGAGFKYQGQDIEYAFQGRTNADMSIGWEHHLSLILNLGGLVKRSRVALDNVPPVLSLKGDSVMTISTRDGFFIDSGSTAYDKVSGDLTGKIVADAQVNPTVPGTYYITYTIADEAGNKATKKRTIHVWAPDTIAPVITLLGDTVMTLGTGETFIDPGVRAKDNKDSILPPVTITGSVDVSKPGDYVIAYAVSDKAGNMATKQRKIKVIPQLFKTYGVPAEKPLATMIKTFTKLTVEGNGGPDLSKLADFKIDWTLEDSTLKEIGFDTNSAKPKAKPRLKLASLKDRVQQSFKTNQPKLTLINSGVPNFDGEYFVVEKEGNLVWVKTDGTIAVTFKP